MTIRQVAATPGDRARFNPWLAVGVLLVAFNLRPGLSVLGPLLAPVQREFAIASSTASLLITLPVLCFGLLSSLVPMLARRLGMEAAILVSLVLIAVGIALRTGTTFGIILFGTVILGAAITIGNVLLPSLVKHSFPRHTGLMTGLYSVALTSGASIAAALAIPVRDWLQSDWRAPLELWAWVALVTALAWVPQLWHRQQTSNGATQCGGSLWRDPIAWQVTLFMGLQSLAFYTCLTWLATIFFDYGFSPAKSGVLLSLFNAAGIPAALFIPSLAARLPNQRLLAAVLTGITIAGVASIMLAPVSLAYPSVTVLGIGQGSLLGLALMLIVLRARDSQQAAQISSMAQTVGYLLAATGPLLFGLLHDASGGWTLPLAMLMVSLMVQLVVGWGAGRNLQAGKARDGPAPENSL